MVRRTTGLTINKTRGLLYLLAKLLGDFQAARKGRIGKRIARRTGAVQRGMCWGLFKSEPLFRCLLLVRLTGIHGCGVSE